MDLDPYPRHQWIRRGLVDRWIPIQSRSIHLLHYTDAINQTSSFGAGQTPPEKRGKKDPESGGKSSVPSNEKKTQARKPRPVEDAHGGEAPNDAASTSKKKEGKNDGAHTPATPLWTHILKKSFRPQNQSEEKKAANGTLAKAGSRKDTRVFLRFEGTRPDEVVVEHAVRGCLTEEENKGVMRANMTRNAVAILVKSEQAAKSLVDKQEIIKAATGAMVVQTGERWNKFLFRGVTRLRMVKGSWAALAESDVRYEVEKNQGPTDIKKVCVIKLAGCEEKCNVIVFTGEATEVKRNTTLFGDRVGAVKITDKTGPRFCRNCKSFHVGLCRKESKCENCGKAKHGACDRETRCATYLGGHKSSDPRCPLRPRRTGDQWHYPSEWIIQAKRKQVKADLKAKVKEATAKEAEKANPAGLRSNKGKGPAEWN